MTDKTDKSNPLPMGDLFTANDYDYIHNGFGTKRSRTSLQEASEKSKRCEPLHQASHKKER